MKKILSAFMSMVMVFTLMSALAFPAAALTIAEADKSATRLSFDKTIKLDLVEDQSFYEKYVWCKLTVTSDTLVDMTISHERSSIRWTAYSPEESKGTKGRADYSRIFPIEEKEIFGKYGHNAQLGSPATYSYLIWDSSEEKAEGIFTYKLIKGTYYFRFSSDSLSNSNTEFKVTVSKRGNSSATTVTDSKSASSSTDAIAMAVKLKKGETIQLDTIPSADGVKWTSSKDSVATVSSSGKVTAKAKGTATIKATANGKTTSVRISVG